LKYTVGLYLAAKEKISGPKEVEKKEKTQEEEENEL